MLLHVVGDIIGKGTLLEGSLCAQSGILLRTFNRCLKAIIDALKQSGLCDDAAKDAICRDLFGSGLAATRKGHAPSRLTAF